jgi:hypothetical protein
VKNEVICVTLNLQEFAMQIPHRSFGIEKRSYLCFLQLLKWGTSLKIVTTTQQRCATNNTKQLPV